MSEFISSQPIALPAQRKALPEPRVPFTVRAGVSGDLSFIDALQKQHRKQVGWMPMVQLAGKIAAGHVLIAEDTGASGEWQGASESVDSFASDSRPSPLSPHRLGYVIGNDRYFKRDDCGVIYQMNVVPGTRRRLVGATLLQALFERSAYGCRLYCCWCAQDIEANRFWEACGFVPLAFRAGGRKSSVVGRRSANASTTHDSRPTTHTPRVHIFWQKRIRAGDTTTPWWYPTETSGGSIRENRVVLPIPPNTHWSDAKPLVLPGVSQIAADRATEPKRLPAAKKTPSAARSSPPTAEPKRAPVVSTQALGLRFGSPPPVERPAGVTPEAAQAPHKTERAPRATAPEPPRRRNDPELVAKARELRDRWLEQLNAQELATPAAEYDVTRRLPGETTAVPNGTLPVPNGTVPVPDMKRIAA